MLICPHFFKWLYCWRSEFSWLFQIHYELSEFQILVNLGNWSWHEQNKPPPAINTTKLTCVTYTPPPSLMSVQPTFHHIRQSEDFSFLLYFNQWESWIYESCSIVGSGIGLTVSIDRLKCRSPAASLSVIIFLDCCFII